jgi:hypothetical protein
MDREKRRLISGVIFLATGGILMLLALLGSELILGFWIRDWLELDTKSTILILVFINLFLAGMSLRIGGYLAKGPYLPETLEGIAKTTKAVLGKN